MRLELLQVRGVDSGWQLVDVAEMFGPFGGVDTANVERSCRKDFEAREREISGHPESNQGPSDVCTDLQSDALPTEL